MTTNQQPPRRPMSSASLWGIFGTLTVVALAMVILVAILLSKSCGNSQPNPDGTHTMTYRVRTVNPFHKLQSDHARLAGAYKAQKARADKLEAKIKADAQKKLTDKMADDERLIKELQAELKRLKASLKEAADAKTAAEKFKAMKKAAEAAAKIKDLEARLKRSRSYAWSLRQRNKKPKGDSATTKLLKEHLVEFKALNKRVKAITNKGTKGTSTGGKPPKGMAAAN